MKALYNLSGMIAGFDFFPWLVMQTGAREIVFDNSRPRTDKWSVEEISRRFDSILWPGPALLGLRCSIGTVGQQLGPYHQKRLVHRWQRGIKFPRLRSVLPKGAERYTVTLRRTERTPARNSVEDDWRIFANEIGARIIPDYADEPIHLHERMALYAGAEMNFFVTNGPAMLCFLSEYPAWQFGCRPTDSLKVGLKAGLPLPYLLPQHRQIFEPATLEVIRKHWYAQQSAA